MFDDFGHVMKVDGWMVLDIDIKLHSNSADIKAEYDTEVEQLRKLAQKGLPNKQTSDADIALRAGSEIEIKTITHVVVKHGGVKAIINLVKAYVVADHEKKEHEEDVEAGKMKTKEEKEAEEGMLLMYWLYCGCLLCGHAMSLMMSHHPTATRAKKEAHRLHQEELAKKWGRSAVHKEEKHTNYGMSAKVAESMAGALLSMATDPTNRGKFGMICDVLCVMVMCYVLPCMHVVDVGLHAFMCHVWVYLRSRVMISC